ncbi:MAG: indolepyruvate ferredoxin oxidoreductase subunit alpha [Armatimonadota bacterium]|nr:MAG: indolepyruvate ferredoxin oxidoreductase subunit alpha [Armatimonadota bacterium]
MRFLSGNEAIARGAYEAGVKLAAAYPGTPSTEILEALATYDGIHAQWSPNEKVALDVAFGAALGGVRAMAAMKHVGLNVAADSLFTISYTGSTAGLVVISADDPAMHSSQNEQDNRHYARAAKVPMLEPADSQEAKDFVLEAFRISEEFDTPVLLRTTTRISHGKSVVRLGKPVSAAPRHFERDTRKYVMIPGHARPRHVVVEERLERLREFSNRSPLNRVEMGDPSIGIIAAGVAYQYARDARPDAWLLRLGMSYPLPDELIRDFASRVKRLYVIEELDPFLETEIAAMGIKVRGKPPAMQLGELDAGAVAAALGGRSPRTQPVADLPGRPPVLCPGCPHSGVFHVLRKLKAVVAGDIGCYTLSVLPPLECMDTCVCMGASVGHASGLERAFAVAGDERPVVAALGDSTFVHAGITPLIDVVYNQGCTTVIILDNRTTAMTGRQNHPATGRTARGEETHELDLEALCRACGVDDVAVADPYDLGALEQTLKRAISARHPSVVITRRECVLLTRGARRIPARVIEDACVACGLCLSLGCPALGGTPTGPKGRLKPVVAVELCAGCGLCAQICRHEAIVMERI